MAVVAGHLVFLVFAGTPKCEMPIAFVTSQADASFLIGGDCLVVEAEDPSGAAPATGLRVLQRVDMAGLAVGTFEIPVLAMFGRQIVFDVIRVTVLANFRFGSDGPRWGRFSGVCSANK